MKRRKNERTNQKVSCMKYEKWFRMLCSSANKRHCVHRAMYSFIRWMLCIAESVKRNGCRRSDLNASLLVVSHVWMNSLLISLNRSQILISWIYAAIFVYVILVFYWQRAKSELHGAVLSCASTEQFLKPNIMFCCYLSFAEKNKCGSRKKRMNSIAPNSLFSFTFDGFHLTTKDIFTTTFFLFCFVFFDLVILCHDYAKYAFIFLHLINRFVGVWASLSLFVSSQCAYMCKWIKSAVRAKVFFFHRLFL